MLMQPTRTMAAGIVLGVYLAGIAGAGTLVPQTVNAPGQTHKTKPGPVRNVDLMAGMMTDMDSLLNHENITVRQRKQIMKIMGEMGGVMQEMGTAQEIEGWQLRQQSFRLHELKKSLDALKIEIEKRR